jgi:hypothetical protein
VFNNFYGYATQDIWLHVAGIFQVIFNLDNLYGHRYYIQPERKAWDAWFAWYPVKLIYWYDQDPFSSDHPIKLSKIVWLTRILRRRVIDHHAGPRREFAESVAHWEYTTVLNLLKWG